MCIVCTASNIPPPLQPKFTSLIGVGHPSPGCVVGLGVGHPQLKHRRHVILEHTWFKEKHPLESHAWTHATCGHHTAFCGVLKAAFLNLKPNCHQSLIMKMEIAVLTKQSLTLVSHTWIVNNSGFLHMSNSPSFCQKILTSLAACYIFSPKFKTACLPRRKEPDPRGSRHPTCDTS